MTSIEDSIQKISNLIGSENVLQDKDDLDFYSTDIFGTAKEQAVAVVRPANADELISLVKLCIEDDVSISTRGGGASYTSSFLPVRKETVIIDSQRLKKIEVNEEDMYVTVE
ncbi:MAG: FAD-binding oxidoreductase, partial [Gammaproteobacteria bacterium]